MVHALQEVWRTMKPGGVLLDLRPFLPFGPLELVVDGEAQTLGRLEEAPYDPGDPAADEALAEIMRRGFFTLEETGSFHYAGYWEAVSELREYLQDWQDVARLPRGLAGQAHKALRRSGRRGRLRLKTYMIFNRMRRVAPGL